MSFLRLPFASRLLAGLALTLALLPSQAAPAVADAPLPAGVATALARARVPRDAVSMLVLPLQGSRARLQHRTQVPMNPASVMKMVTTLAALDTLGGGYTWTTKFLADGPVADGTLNGNLYIQGGGDPKLVLERIDAAFRELQALGVTRVRGDMVLDHSIFEIPAHDPAAFDNEPLRPYNVAPDGLLVNFKALILRFVPQADGGVALVQSEPPLAGVTVDAQVPLAPGEACGTKRRISALKFTSRPSGATL
jgi:D-alanyl-D-alanine carboxypeptidase/D-alanyl-D-alanine-endopeptidase (penicillin-binding protein 4)